MTAKPRIGLLGGSFDPIHIGHLIMAENACEQLGLDLVIFAPAGNPPHKPNGPLASIDDRIVMIELAIDGHSGFVCSRIDSEESEPSFTWRLLERIHAEHRGADVFFIMGGDSLREFGSWARPERILELATIAVVDRPGHEVDESALDAGPGLAEAIVMIETPSCAISSTGIRERVRDGQSIRYLGPDQVRQYIGRRSLYQ